MLTITVIGLFVPQLQKLRRRGIAALKAKAPIGEMTEGTYSKASFIDEGID